MNEEINTVSEEQVLHNKLSFEINQELIHLMKRIVELQQENARLKDKENKIIKKLESYNLDYLHETNEHNLADTIEYLLELLKEN